MLEFFLSSDCLRSHINLSDDPIVKCPHSRDYNCDFAIQEREIRGIRESKRSEEKGTAEISDYKNYQIKCLSRSV